MSRQLVECTHCGAVWELFGPMLRPAEQEVGPDDLVEKDKHFICDRCSDGKRHRGPLDRTRMHQVDGYTTTGSTRDIDGLGGKRRA